MSTIPSVRFFQIGLRALNAYTHPLEAALNTTMQSDRQIDHAQRMQSVEKLQEGWLQWHNDLAAHAGQPPAEERTLMGNFLDSMYALLARFDLGAFLIETRAGALVQSTGEGRGVWASLYPGSPKISIGDSHTAMGYFLARADADWETQSGAIHPWSTKARMTGRAFGYAGSMAVLGSATDTIIPLTAVVSWTPSRFALASSLGRTRLANDTEKRIEMHRRTGNWDRNNDTGYKPEPLATKNLLTGAMDWGLINWGCGEGTTWTMLKESIATSSELYSLALKVKNVIALHKSGLLALEGEEAAFWLALGGSIYKPLCRNCQALAHRSFARKTFCDVGDEAMKEFRSWGRKTGRK
ncbi:hypothetical protein C8F04DRAFT_1315163 [Mycena alexandri]|uniref:Uncharacterized protein n=1 Tax=Mycena alexandri TaxID=1745969 RepID=A0AAD6T6I4_9AGAR|nr:hypothetical protein C8F04DRAFT_1315163 [Mycena alexandri]